MQGVEKVREEKQWNDATGERAGRDVTEGHNTAAGLDNQTLERNFPLL